ncbi:MAG: hypothetical protein QOD74_2978 [Variibacter sp.]|nr:hypothetical protein [Variibacter sp.]
MRILVTGAYGLIGSAICARLASEGHEVIGVGRNIGVAARRLRNVRWIRVDFGEATTPDAWLPHLSGVDAVVNCVGVLQDAPGNAIRDVHVNGAAALFAACERAGVRRVIHFSAVGANEQRGTDFSNTKGEAEAALRARDLDWVILRPSVVVGRAAYGGSALLRALAAIPFFRPQAPATGELQIVQLDDVASTVLFFLKPGAPARETLEIVGPERLTFNDAVLAYRRWLGLGEGRPLSIPSWSMHAMYRLGDFAGWLGWRPPVRSTAQKEIVYGAVGDPSEWTRLTGIVPQPLAAALAAEPATVQERWFARLYLLKPLIFFILALFWLGTGLVSVGPGYGVGIGLMRDGGIEGPLAAAAVIGGGLLDIMIGLGMLQRRTVKWALIASLVVSVVYFVIGTIIVPKLWIDPLGPMMKIWPIFVFTLVALAILDDR